MQAQEERILNLKQVMRIAVCAAIIALCAAGLFSTESVAEQRTLKSSAVTNQYESSPVKWMTGLIILHQLQCCLSQGFSPVWFLPGAWLCNQNAMEIYHQITCTGGFYFPLADDY